MAKAKKKVSKKSGSSPAVKKTNAKSIVRETIKAEKPAAKNNKTLIFAVAAAVFIFLIVEIFITVRMQVSMNKKPVLIANWSPEYKGQAGMPVYNDHLYIIDNNVNQVKKYHKLEGRLIDVYGCENTPKWAVENSKGETIVLEQGSNTLSKYSGRKKAGKIELSGVKDITNMTIDSGDNLYVGDGGSGKIVKFSPEGEKIAEFGGIGAGKAQFLGLGRIFIDNKDNIYAFDNSVFKIKVFNSKGSFVNEIKLKSQKFFGPEYLAIAPDGMIYFNDLSENKIVIYSPKGKFVGKFDSDMANKYRISSPGALSGGLDGNIYVGSHTLAVFEAIKF